MSKLATKIENFSKALERLKEATDQFVKTDNTVIRDGVIQRFEFTYELAWKTTKEFLEEIGIVEKNSPKSAFKEAYARKLITNEDKWLLMIKDRNTTSHIYSEEMAEEIVQRIVDDYVDEFQLLLRNIQRGVNN